MRELHWNARVLEYLEPVPLHDILTTAGLSTPTGRRAGATLEP